MFKKIKSLLLVTLVTGASVVGCAKTTVEDDMYRVTLVMDEGGVNDQSFNQSAWEGALRAEEKYNVDVHYIESNQEGDYMPNIENAIDLDSDLVVGVGFKITDAIKDAAESYPEQKFAIIDGTYDEIPSNVQSIMFNEEQAGYAAGLVAAKTTDTGVVGFVGGMDIPSCSNFLVGFEKAIKEEDANIKVLSQYANSFTDAAKGKIISEQMIMNNADIIFMASGGGNVGVIEAVRENNIKAIGVDMPSNYIAPEHIITSALKNVGTGLELTIKDLVNGEFEGGKVKLYDLSNGGVGFEKTDLLDEELIEYVEEKLNN